MCTYIKSNIPKFHVHTYTNAYVRTYTHTDTKMYAYSDMYMNVHTHIHKNIQRNRRCTVGGIISIACSVLLQGVQLPHLFLLLLTQAHVFSSLYTAEDSSPARTAFRELKFCSWYNFSAICNKKRTLTFNDVPHTLSYIMGIGFIQLHKYSGTPLIRAP